MTGGVDINLQAMGAFATAVDNTAGNIVNVSTEGYQPVTTVFESGPDYIFALSVNANDYAPDLSSASPGSSIGMNALANQGSGVDIAREMVNLVSYENGFQANMAAAGVIEQTSGSILSLFA